MAVGRHGTIQTHRHGKIGDNLPYVDIYDEALVADVKLSEEFAALRVGDKLQLLEIGRNNGFAVQQAFPEFVRLLHLAEEHKEELPFLLPRATARVRDIVYVDANLNKPKSILKGSNVTSSGVYSSAVTQAKSNLGKDGVFGSMIGGLRIAEKVDSATPAPEIAYFDIEIEDILFQRRAIALVQQLNRHMVNEGSGKMTPEAKAAMH
jgi:hypothetical protein